MQKRLSTGDRAPTGEVLDIEGNPVELGSRWSDGPTLLVLLRHFGCIFCRAWMTEIEGRMRDIKEAGIRQVILVALGEPKHAAFFGSRLAPSAQSYASPSTELYTAYGFAQGTLGQLMGPRTAVAALRATAGGHRQGVATGDVRMLGGTFIVDRQGIVQNAYYSRYAGDNPDLGELLSRPVVASNLLQEISHA